MGRWGWSQPEGTPGTPRAPAHGLPHTRFVSARRWNWFLLRMMWLQTPVTVVIALALLVQGQIAAGGLVAAIAIVMAVAGYRTRGQRLPDE